MKIKNVNLINKFVHFENISLEFNHSGVYLISGKNGSGKTLLMEKIVFDSLEIEFDCKEHEILYQNSRSNLFAYVPQDIVESPVNVYEYIAKGNKHVSGKKIDELLKLFHMDDILPTQAFVTLSGGEKNKLAIISALMKDTPYVFMDEPTNSLDDSSVELFQSIINEYAKNRTFIIISHDQRLILDHATNVLVENNQIEYKSVKTHLPKNNLISVQQKHPNYLSLMFLTAKNRINTQLMFLFLFCSFAFVAFTHFMFFTGFARNEAIPKNDILVYSVDGVYSELNQIYAKGENLTVKTENYYNTIYYTNIPTISELNGVQKIYLPDIEYYHQHYTLPLSNDDLLDEMAIFSLPEVMTSSSDLNHLWFDTVANYLTIGRLPKDEANEVSISANLLINFYGYQNDDIETAIGNEIMVDGNQYTIVGIQYSDICMVSYSSGDNYGIYEYNELTYDAYSNRMQLFLTNQHARTDVSSFLILTDNGYERTVLNRLMIDYPANNYYSNHYSLVWDMQYNQDFFVKMRVIALIVGVTFGVIFMFLTKNQILLNILKIQDYENYYIDRRKIKQSYILMKIIEYLFIFMMTILCSGLMGLLSGFFIEFMGILIMELSLFVFPSMIYTLIRMKYVV